MIKEKAKDHSAYMRTTTHHSQLAKPIHHQWQLNNWQKVLACLGILLVIAFIAIALGLEA